MYGTYAMHALTSSNYFMAPDFKFKFESASGVCYNMGYKPMCDSGWCSIDVTSSCPAVRAALLVICDVFGFGPGQLEAIIPAHDVFVRIATEEHLHVLCVLFLGHCCYF